MGSIHDLPHKSHHCIITIYHVIGRFGRVILTSKDGDRNMLRADVWKELRLLDGLIQNMTVYHNEEYYTYKEICAKWMTECFQNDILNLDYIIDEVSSKIAADNDE